MKLIKLYVIVESDDLDKVNVNIISRLKDDVDVVDVLDFLDDMDVVKESEDVCKLYEIDDSR